MGVADGSVSPGSYNCRDLPSTLQPGPTLAGPYGYHGLAIDNAGRMVGSDTSALIRSTREGPFEVWVPNLGPLEQMLFLPNGDLVISSEDDGALRKVNPSGSISVLSSDLWAYGLVLGPDHQLYTAGSGGVHRVNPASGERTAFLELDSNGEADLTPHSIEFDAEGSRLFIGMIGRDALFGDGPTPIGEDGGVITYFDLDENHNPVGNMQTYATGVGGGYPDAIGMDACGNLWLTDFITMSLYRVDPERRVVRVLGWSDGDDDLEGAKYGHGILWGNGQNGWREDAIYLPMPYADYRVQELVIGIPSRNFTGSVQR